MKKLDLRTYDGRSQVESFVVKGLEMWLYFHVLTHFIKLRGEQVANSVMPLRHETPIFTREGMIDVEAISARTMAW